MNNPKYCKELLNRILPSRKIKDLKVLSNSFLSEKGSVSTQHTINVDILAKGVRLDVIFEDNDTIYNIEMQCINKPYLPQRARYYSSQLDLEQLSKGDSYMKLKDSFVIFLCTFDPFGQGFSVYEFENYDKKHQLQLNDGRFTIYVNSTSKENGISKELTNLFTYMIDSQIDENDSFLTELENEISILNREDGEWRRQIMRLDEKIALEKEEAAEKALAEGIELGKKEAEKAAKEALAKGIESSKKEAENKAKKSMIKVAKALKVKEFPIEEIISLTNLTPEEIEKL